ncbi:Magnesium transporter NIPA [Penicillium angulare]|uniref:Magnesium transporter NIPA n=1 Tax=Penicillium angulare TaxID=116970 RepID=A0A9W9FJ58_9EURO|nr:Magnesium transporter NIPA [Penicillium angulare]
MGNLGDLSPQSSVAIGILVGLVSTSLQAIGLTLQRKSHLLEDEKHPYDVRRPPYKRRRWQVGMAMFVISNIVGSTIQITTLPLPVLSTLQASGLVFNTIFATLILGEPFTRYSFAGTTLVCIGALLIATFGAIGEPAHTLNQLLILLRGRPFLIWMGCTLILVAIILVGSKLLKYLLPGTRGKTVAPSHFTTHFLRVQSRIKLFRGMCYGSVSGILSAHSLLLAKTAVELLVRTLIDGENQFNRWQSWVILLGMIALALTQLFYLHRGLKLCSTSILYPFVFCIYNIIAILDGLIYFRQASQLAGFHAGLIALGTIILLGGVLCLSWRLEDIDSHAAVTSVGPTQTGLGPGMGVLEENSPSSSALLDGFVDEESGLGEREPLLHGSIRSRQFSSYTRSRAPSLPINQSLDQHEAADLNAASIWAELDDSDHEFASAQMRNWKDRPRSSSSSAALQGSMSGNGRHSTVGPVSYQRVRGSHRRRSSTNENPRRRSSMPWAGLMSSQRKRQNTSGFDGYGAIQENESDHGPRDEVTDHQSQTSADGLLAGSRRLLQATWRRGRHYMSGWTSPQAGTRSDFDEQSRASSPLFRRAETRSPRTNNTQNLSTDGHRPELRSKPSSSSL